MDELRILEDITEGQADLGTGIVNLTYLGNDSTRPELVRLRAASQPAELDVEEISLLGDRLSATGSVTDRAEGVVRLRFSYVDPDGSPTVHEARAEIQDDGGWALDDDQVPAQLAQCGGYLSIQFTGYFERTHPRRATGLRAQRGPDATALTVSDGPGRLGGRPGPAPDGSLLISRMHALALMGVSSMGAAGFEPATSRV